MDQKWINNFAILRLLVRQECKVWPQGDAKNWNLVIFQIKRFYSVYECQFRTNIIQLVQCQSWYNFHQSLLISETQLSLLLSLSGHILLHYIPRKHSNISILATKSRDLNFCHMKWLQMFPLFPLAVASFLVDLLSRNTDSATPPLQLHCGCRRYYPKVQ